MGFLLFPNRVIPVARSNTNSKKVFGNNFPYEGAAIFERILNCATKHASAGNASEERSLKDSGKSPYLIEKRIFKYFLRNNDRFELCESLAVGIPK
jgi:hypothetical protein